MNESIEFVVRSVLIGAGATIIMDAWAAGLRWFGVPSLDFALLGRWMKTFEQAKLQQQEDVEAERRARASWLGDVWSALLHSVGSAAPLAPEAACGKLAPVARAATTEAAEARLRELVSAKSLCRNVASHDKQQELRLELELGPAIEGTAAGWLGIFATRYLAAMLERPLRTGELELTGERLAVHALRWRSSSDTEPRAG